jgi:hypothetical protein
MALSFFRVDEWPRNFETSRTINNWYDAFIDKVGDLNLASSGHRVTSAGLREMIPMARTPAWASTPRCRSSTACGKLSSVEGTDFLWTATAGSSHLGKIRHPIRAYTSGMFGRRKALCGCEDRFGSQAAVEGVRQVVGFASVTGRDKLRLICVDGSELARRISSRAAGQRAGTCTRPMPCCWPLLMRLRPRHWS